MVNGAGERAVTRACNKIGRAVVPHLRSGDANVCVALLPWWNIGVEARKRNESCVVIHSTPTQERDASKMYIQPQ